MITVNIHEAKTNLSKLLAMVEKGETITIAKAGRPIATIQPIVQQKPKRTFGSMKGEIWVADDFDVLPEEMLAEFEPNYENWYKYFEPEKKDKKKSVKRKASKTRKKRS